MTLKTIPDYLDHWVAVQPEKRFAAFLDARGRIQESHTYLSFDRRSRSLSEHLVRDTRLAAGERALLVHAPGLELVCAFVACTRIGAIPVIAPPPKTPEGRLRLMRMLEDCGARVILTDQRSRETLDALLGSSPLAAGCTMRETDALPDLYAPVVAEARSDVLFLQYTSGSTDDPKGVMVSHSNVIHNCKVTAHKDAVGVSWLPQFHDMGMIGFYLFLIVTGGTTYGFSPADFLRRPALWLETLSRYRGTITSSPNFGFDYCLSASRVPDSVLEGIDLSSVRVFMNGAEPVDPDTYRKFHARFAPHGLSATAHAVGYGLAENTLAVSFGGAGRSLRLDPQALQRGLIGVSDDPGAVEVMSCGRPLTGIGVRIVDPDSRREVSPHRIGEIWLNGPSTCTGYWNRPDLSRRTFANTIAGDAEGAAYLRTGDLGFLKDGEIHVCGRLKDIIILRGKNYFAGDLEAIVAAACPEMRADSLVAFQETGPAGALVVAIGGGPPSGCPDLSAALHGLRAYGYDGPVRLILISPKEIIRTSSGKLARGRLRARWIEGTLPTIDRLFDPGIAALPEDHSLESRYFRILAAYSLSGDEQATLGELGLDSLAIVELVLALEQVADSIGAPTVKSAIDGPLLQSLPLAALTGMIRRVIRDGPGALRDFHALLAEEADRLAARDHQAMARDASFICAGHPAGTAQGPHRDVLMTGGTGFLGPFLLAGLLDSTEARINVLVRAEDPETGRARIAQGLRSAGVPADRIRAWLAARIGVTCGDLARKRLGLADGQWSMLADQTDGIVHSGAVVDYALTYQGMREVNVEGTRTLLNLALSGRPKRFHHVSSTIIFGWSARESLREDDCNARMAELDFGYAQSKWVAEQLVLAARGQGLDARIYRPSFVTASLDGVGDQSDIVIRMLAFMINHGLAPRTVNQVSFLPADIAAHNMARLIAAPRLEGNTFHVTVADYYNLMDVTRVITEDYGVRFDYVEIEDFVREMRALCTQDDLAYPLLDFVTRMRNKFSAMRDKRYSNAAYRRALDVAGMARPDPDLHDTVAGIIAYMGNEGLLHRDVLLRRTGVLTGR